MYKHDLADWVSMLLRQLTGLVETVLLDSSVPMDVPHYSKASMLGEMVVFFSPKLFFIHWKETAVFSFMLPTLLVFSLHVAKSNLQGN